MTEAQALGDARLLASAERLLADAEQRIRLLDRLTPKNLAGERKRLEQRLAAGERAEPRFEYESPSGLTELCRELDRWAELLPRAGMLGELYAERAQELLLEARLVESIGTPALRALAQLRYPSADNDELGVLLQEFGSAPLEATAELILASDANDARSLLNVLRAQIEQLGVPVRIELRPHLHSVAAAGDGFVAVRADAQLTPHAAQRIAQHELFAHVLPRIAAERERHGIYRVGTRGANEDEEGRALYIEQRRALLDGARRHELVRRHRLALAVRAGADFNELVASLTRDGVSRAAAIELSLRALRGGGLAREAVYLPAYLRVARAFAEEPESERYFERGRVALSALPALRALES